MSDITEKTEKERLQEVEPGLTIAEFEVKTVRHRWKNGYGYGNPSPCQKECGTQYCANFGCRFSGSEA